MPAQYGQTGRLIKMTASSSWRDQLALIECVSTREEKRSKEQFRLANSLSGSLFAEWPFGNFVTTCGFLSVFWVGYDKHWRRLDMATDQEDFGSETVTSPTTHVSDDQMDVSVPQEDRTFDSVTKWTYQY